MSSVRDIAHLGDSSSPSITGSLVEKPQLSFNEEIRLYLFHSHCFSFLEKNQLEFSIADVTVSSCRCSVICYGVFANEYERDFQVYLFFFFILT